MPTVEIKDSRLLLGLPADEILGSIIKYAAINKKYPNSNDPFDQITLLMRVSSVCKALEHLKTTTTLKIIKAALNVTQEELNSSLHAYAFWNNDTRKRDYTPFLKLLIAMGAQVNRHCKNLTLCVSTTKNTYIAEYFITHYTTDIDQPNEEGDTPLYRAIKAGKPDMVKILLKHNADIFLVNRRGRTPIHYALIWKRTGCIKVLIKDGLDNITKYDTGRYNTARVYKTIIANWAKKNRYGEIYTLITGEEIPKPSDDESIGTLSSNGLSSNTSAILQ